MLQAPIAQLDRATVF